MRLYYVEYGMENMNCMVGWLDIGMRLFCFDKLWLIYETWFWVWSGCNSTKVSWWCLMV